MKSFDAKLYKENNGIAIKKISEYLISTGKYYYDVHPIDQLEKYKDYDFYLINKESDKKIFFEVERKKCWTMDGVWQGYETLDVPFRKNKSKADGYVMINNNLNTLALINMIDIKLSKISCKNTIYTNNEYFFNVELDKVKFVNI